MDFNLGFPHFKTPLDFMIYEASAFGSSVGFYNITRVVRLVTLTYRQIVSEGWDQDIHILGWSTDGLAWTEGFVVVLLCRRVVFPSVFAHSFQNTPHSLWLGEMLSPTGWCQWSY